MRQPGVPNGIIMVESNPHAQNARPNTVPETTGGKKKNKKKKAKAESNENVHAGHQPQNHEQMVTLKNPMFQHAVDPKLETMMRNMQTPPYMTPLPAEPQGASITRNENGMYTIRNPSFQNAFGMDTPGFVPRPQMEQSQRPHTSSQFSSYGSEDAPVDSAPKCSSVIGSEMKPVLKRRQEQEFNSGMDGYNPYGIRNSPMPSYSHFGGSGVNFSNNGTHLDDNFPSTYSRPVSYDDLRLQPGQMLNPEVSLLALLYFTGFLIKLMKLTFFIYENF